MPHTVRWYEARGRGLKICAGMARAKGMTPSSASTATRREVMAIIYRKWAILPLAGRMPRIEARYMRPSG